MQQIKFFKCLENEAKSLELEVNAWLKESKAKIISINGNIAPQSVTSHPKAHPAPSDMLLIVLYEIPE